MARHYQKTFTFYDTAEQAQEFCSTINANASAYVRRRHPAHFTLWSSAGGSEQKYICWYYR